MAERKVLIKYYPPDFDPKLLVKNFRKRDKQDNVRMMMPLTCRCDSCGQYAYIGTKFNMRKETVLNQNYLGIRIYRFYFKCLSCYSQIAFVTDPKNHDYIDVQAAENAMKELREQDEEGDSMRFLENRTKDSKREIDINDAIEETMNLLKSRNKLNPETILKQLFLYQADQQEDIDCTEDEQETMEEIRQRRMIKRIDEECEKIDTKTSIVDLIRLDQVKEKKDLNEIKKPMPIIKKKIQKSNEEDNKKNKLVSYSDSE